MRTDKKLSWLLVGICGLSGCGGSGSTSTLPKPRPPADDDPPPAVAPIAPPAVSPGKASPAAPATPVVASAGNPAASSIRAGAAAAAANSQPADATTAAGSAPVPSAVSEPDKRKHVVNQLREISKALESYRERTNTYPFRSVGGRAGCLSWRVMLLPSLGKTDLYKKFRLSETWDSPHNRALLPEIPEVFASVDHLDGCTNIMFVSGPGTAYASAAGLGEHCPDGWENTLFVVEVSNALARPWTAPEDYEFTRATVQADLFDLHRDCCYGILGGKYGVRRIAADVPDPHLLALISPSGGEKFPLAQTAAYPHFEVDQKLIDRLAANPFPRFGAGKPGALAASSKRETGASEPSAVPRQGDAPVGNAAVTGLADRKPSGGFAPAAGAASAPEKDQRPLPPTDQAVAKAAAAVKEAFGPQYEAARTPQQRRAFAKKLLEEAAAMTDDKDGLYVMLRAARDVAVQAGDAVTAVESVDRLATSFRVDSLPIKVKALEQAMPQIGNQSDLRSFAETSLKLASVALAKDDFQSGGQLLKWSQSAAKRAGALDLEANIAGRQSELQIARAAHNQLSEHLHTLLRDSNDPAACAAVGRYFCFLKRDWNRGLELLAKGDDESLSAIAQSEATPPDSPEGMLELGDRWWEAAERRTNNWERLGMRRRAAEWYARGLPKAKASVTKVRAEKRYADAPRDAVDPASPLARTNP